MNKLATLIAKGEITVQELAGAQELIDRAELVTKGINACKKTITFVKYCCFLYPIVLKCFLMLI